MSYCRTAKTSSTSAHFPESQVVLPLLHRQKVKHRDYGSLMVCTARRGMMEPEFWSPLFTILTLLISSHDQRSGGTLPACILETLQTNGRAGEASLHKLGQSYCFSPPPPPHFPAAEGQLGSQVGVGQLILRWLGSCPPLLQLSSLRD